MLEIGVLRLHSAVQHYAWDEYDFIPGRLGIANKSRRPFAGIMDERSFKRAGNYLSAS